MLLTRAQSMRNSLHALKLCALDGVKMRMPETPVASDQALLDERESGLPEQVSSPLEDQPTRHDRWRGGRINLSQPESQLLSSPPTDRFLDNIPPSRPPSVPSPRQDPRARMRDRRRSEMGRAEGPGAWQRKRWRDSPPRARRGDIRTIICTFAIGTSSS